jgi:hypothetical protein
LWKNASFFDKNVVKSGRFSEKRLRFWEILLIFKENVGIFGIFPRNHMCLYILTMWAMVTTTPARLRHARRLISCSKRAYYGSLQKLGKNLQKLCKNLQIIYLIYIILTSDVWPGYHCQLTLTCDLGTICQLTLTFALGAICQLTLTFDLGILDQQFL